MKFYIKIIHTLTKSLKESKKEDRMNYSFLRRLQDRRFDDPLKRLQKHSY